ncbi:hypothetical protein GWK47_049887 [Chionoecetes opilio]|uniref:Uncharacterized protein n=1 Tax=Chionoecetes opilio TaxID=41210 RepID=A0A8J4YAM4_CHIOP|nr:hypothetical protein GWK47_049887 [Chionoecetes opilio]
MTACYGQNNSDTMSNARLSAWAAKNRQRVYITPKLCSLPPTSEAFEENVKSAHHQASIWRAVKDADPPELDVEKYGWKKDETKQITCTYDSPGYSQPCTRCCLRLIKCGCEVTPYRSSRCGFAGVPICRAQCSVSVTMEFAATQMLCDFMYRNAYAGAKKYKAGIRPPVRRVSRQATGGSRGGVVTVSHLRHWSPCRARRGVGT